MRSRKNRSALIFRRTISSHSISGERLRVNNFEFKIIDENENVHRIKNLNVTYHGMISYTVKSRGKRVFCEVSGSFDVAHHRLLLVSPLSAELCEEKVNGRTQSIPGDRTVVLKTPPSTVECTYR